MVYTPEFVFSSSVFAYFVFAYIQVRAVIEERRAALDLTRDQVLVSTDMYGSTGDAVLTSVNNI